MARKKKDRSLKEWERRAPERRCYNLAVSLGEIGCAVGEVQHAAQTRSANGLLMPLHRIASETKKIADELGPDTPVAKKLSSRGQKLRKLFEKKGLSMGKLTSKEAHFLLEDTRDMWMHVRKLEDAASRSCASHPPGMVHPVQPFGPIPKGFGKR